MPEFFAAGEQHTGDHPIERNHLSIHPFPHLQSIHLESKLGSCAYRPCRSRVLGFCGVWGLGGRTNHPWSLPWPHGVDCEHFHCGRAADGCRDRGRRDHGNFEEEDPWAHEGIRWKPGKVELINFSNVVFDVFDYHDFCWVFLLSRFLLGFNHQYFLIMF